MSEIEFALQYVVLQAFQLFFQLIARSPSDNLSRKQPTILLERSILSHQFTISTPVIDSIRW